MDPSSRVRSTLAPIELVTHIHKFETPPQYFQFQVDLLINLTFRHVRDCHVEETNLLLCFDMSLYFDPAAEAQISHILGQIGTPPDHRLPIARQLFREGRLLARAFRHVDHGWAHMIAYVEIDYFHFLPLPSPADLERAMVERALAESEREAGHGMVPAAEEAVRRALKRVRVETTAEENPKKRLRSRKEAKTTTESKTTCSICLDNIETCGTSMPCSHVFHEGCIVKWLKQSHSCPLCRFQIPTEQNMFKA